MKERNILGLDLGTNSIGWAVVREIENESGEKTLTNILGAGSRIIPMDSESLSNFDKGNSISQTKERTHHRGTRRLFERSKLRRERLNRVLNHLGFLPKHYSDSLTRYGQFKKGVECLLAWTRDEVGNSIFLFKDSYEEMLSEFYKHHPKLKEESLKIPYDWTLYYLRSKALRSRIKDEELAWVLHSFNQKRGYYQARGEVVQKSDTKQVEYMSLKVLDVIKTNNKTKDGDFWYDVILEKDYVYKRVFKEEPQWVGSVRDFIVTTDLDANGHHKIDAEGNVKYSLKNPDENDWVLLKVKTQKDIEESKLFVGEYIFNSLLKNPKQKIKGALVQTIDRKYYQEELKQILKTQCDCNEKLKDRKLYQECIGLLYSHNGVHRNEVSKHNFQYLFLKDIIFYQRPLKSNRALISNCPYESRSYVDSNNETHIKSVKCVPKSHPSFQEFRLWQFLSNLKIYGHKMEPSGRINDQFDMTAKFLPNDEAYVKLFNELNNKESIKQSELLTLLGISTKDKSKYRWNFNQDKELPANTTRGLILKTLKKAKISIPFFTPKAELDLWEILYGVRDKEELSKALKKFANKNGMDEKFVSAMSDFPPFKSEYAAYSLKAINKLLPLMRRGSCWDFNKIDPETRERISKLLTGEYDPEIRDRVRNKTINLKSEEDFKALPLWLACYIVYNRHSENFGTTKWKRPEDIDKYLKEFKQHSLRNPIVEQVVLETCRTVRDIWKQYGHIDEIHIELGREMKNNAEKRKEITANALKNEQTNLRIKALLVEFMNPEFEIDGVCPYSPSQQEILRIYEENVLDINEKNMDEGITKILKKFSEKEDSKRPSKADIKKYKLWLDQKYISPYTGQVIPLSRLFTSDYEIEHIIPQSRYFDDSYSNKVICEAEVNKLKSNMLALEFIKKHHGESVKLSGGRNVNILNEDSYYRHIDEHYKKSPLKMKKLLMDEIPQDFIERQLNDSRYISKFVKSLLSNIVREDDEQEATSKNLIVCSGGVTARLKQDWGLNDVWNRIILPRFERMNSLDAPNKYTVISTNGHIIPDMPLHLQKGFRKKRIDHRHHAMDAIVIACATRNHVSLLNNEVASLENKHIRHDLSHKLRQYEEILITTPDGKLQKKKIAKEFKKPWDTFHADVQVTLENIVVSFKQNLRVINRTTNSYHKFVDGKKQFVKQTVGDSWSIRKPLHKDTVFGEVNLILKKSVSLMIACEKPSNIVDKALRDKVKSLFSEGLNASQIKAWFEKNAESWPNLDSNAVEVRYYSADTKDRYFATRKSVSDFAKKSKKDTNEKESKNDKKELKINITDSGIRKILLAHLANYNNNAERAFSPEGIEAMNKNIVELNGGRFHQPIHKVRVYEKATKFPIGLTGNKVSKFVENEKGTILFCEVIENSKGERTFKEIELRDAIDRLKKGLRISDNASFVLSPNDLVYLPTEQEQETRVFKEPLDRSRIYKCVSFGQGNIYFIPYAVANTIKDKCEFESLNKIQKTPKGEMIKNTCVPLIVDRLGNIKIKKN